MSHNEHIYLLVIHQERGDNTLVFLLPKTTIIAGSKPAWF